MATSKLTGVSVTAVDAQTKDPVLVCGMRRPKDGAVPFVHGDIVTVLSYQYVSPCSSVGHIPQHGCGRVSDCSPRPDVEVHVWAYLETIAARAISDTFLTVLELGQQAE